MRWLSVAALVLLTSCASLTERPLPAKAAGTVEQEMAGVFQRSEWSEHERRAFTLSMIGHGIDLASSVLSDDRCVENNPILGRNPSNGQLLAVKALAIGFEFWLYNTPRFDRNSKTYWYGYTSAIIHASIGIKNFTTNDCYN